MIRAWLARRKLAQVERWARETRVVSHLNSADIDHADVPALMQWLKDGGVWPIKPPPPELRGRRR